MCSIEELTNLGSVLGPDMIPYMYYSTTSLVIHLAQLQMIFSHVIIRLQEHYSFQKKWKISIFMKDEEN